MIPFLTVSLCCRICQGSCGLRSPCKDVAAPAERQAPRQEAEVPQSSSVPISMPWGKAEKGFILYLHAVPSGSCCSSCMRGLHCLGSEHGSGKELAGLFQARYDSCKF